MGARRNYQKEMERILGEIEAEGRMPALLLHSCCAPCSSYCLELLTRHFSVTVFYYNPNISPREEYERRRSEQERLIHRLGGSGAGPIGWREGAYQPERFLEMARGLEDLPEGGERCARCYEMRLRETAKEALAGGFDYFATTLSISPHKDADVLNAIGERVAAEVGARHLPADFKKKDGYRRSIELSKEYGLYRQNYCGCAFSRRDAKREREGGQSGGDRPGEGEGRDAM